MLYKFTLLVTYLITAGCDAVQTISLLSLDWILLAF